MTAKVEAAAAEANPISVLGDALESAAESIGEATSDARESAKIAAKKVKKGLSAGTYHTAYGLSYGFVFSAVFLTELLPEDNIFRRGLATALTPRSMPRRIARSRCCQTKPPNMSWQRSTTSPHRLIKPPAENEAPPLLVRAAAFF